MKIYFFLVPSVIVFSIACAQESKESKESKESESIELAQRYEDKAIKVFLDLLIDKNGEILEIKKAQGNNNPLSLSPFVIHTLKSERFPIKTDTNGIPIQYWISDYEATAGHTRMTNKTLINPTQ